MQGENIKVLNLLTRSRNLLSHPAHWFTEPEHVAIRQKLQTEITEYLNSKKEPTMPKPTKVYIIECELGWGQKTDEVKEFPDYKSAEKFCKDYNTKHNPPSNQTPDWYMYAHLEGQKEYGMLRW